MKPAGQLHVLSASVSKEYTFLDYIQSGWELNMVVAIDFTGSNGNPPTPGTLHYLDPTGHAQNQYEATLTGLSSVLEQYGKFYVSARSTSTLLGSMRLPRRAARLRVALCARLNRECTRVRTPTPPTARHPLFTTHHHPRRHRPAASGLRLRCARWRRPTCEPLLPAQRQPAEPLRPRYGRVGCGRVGYGWVRYGKEWYGREGTHDGSTIV